MKVKNSRFYIVYIDFDDLENRKVSPRKIGMSLRKSNELPTRSLFFVEMSENTLKN